MTREQWEALNEAVSIAITLVNGGIIDMEVRGEDTAHYPEWQKRVQVARQTLIDMGVSNKVFYGERTR